MKKFSTLVLATLLSVGAVAQLKITHPDSTEDLNGTTVTTDHISTEGRMEVALWVINEGTETIDVRLRRTEVDVINGTTHGVCWVICPFPDLVTGAEPVYIVNSGGNELVQTINPGDTIDSSFSFHYFPGANQGTSSFLVEWIDASSNTISDATIIFDSAVGLEELFESAVVRLMPNPANDNVRLNIDGVEAELTVNVMDLLGQQVMTKQVNTGIASNVDLDVSALNNGVYFVSIGDEGKIYRTLRLVVKH